MGINQLNLSSELIASLYPDSLVVETANRVDAVSQKTGRDGIIPETTYPFMGKNLRFACILVSSRDYEFIPENELVFLNKILAACQYSLDDVAIVNSHRHPVTISALKKQFNPAVLFLWGTRSQSLPETHGLADLQISKISEISVLPVWSAYIMNSDNTEALELKKKLWVSLKKLFHL